MTTEAYILTRRRDDLPQLHRRHGHNSYARQDHDVLYPTQDFNKATWFRSREAALQAAQGTAWVPLRIDAPTRRVDA